MEYMSNHTNIGESIARSAPLSLSRPNIIAISTSLILRKTQNTHFFRILFYSDIHDTNLSQFNSNSMISIVQWN